MGRWSRERSFRTILNPVVSFGDQAPHLATGYAPAVIESRLSPRLPLPQGIAVAFIVVGGDTGIEKVGLVVAAYLGALQFSLDQQADA